jgi:hypothetical protein
MLMAALVLKALLTSLAEFYLAGELGLEDLGGREASGRIRVEDGVDDIPAASLCGGGEDGRVSYSSARHAG